jgi:pimeloyl-ACP methyl ester carboxylesterase
VKILFKKLFLIFFLAYIGYGAYLFFSQRGLIYYPNYPARSDFYDCPAFADAEKVDVNGTRAYYKPADEKVAVVYHGNAGSACDRSYLRSVFERAGYAYLFVEYAGYAGDMRKPSRALLLKDAENVIAFLEAKNYRKVTLFTESIGVGVASYHASLSPPDQMLFMTPFDSLANVAKSHFPFSVYPVSFMLRFSGENYENMAHLQNYQGRLMVIHGAKDSVIPIKLGRALFDTMRAPDKKFITIDDAGHNDIYHFERVWEGIDGFLNQ